MPHPYSTLADIQSVLPECTDERLGTGRIPTTQQIAAWIEENDCLIDGQLATIQPRTFTLPLAEVTPTIVGISRDLTAGRIRNAIYKDRPRADQVDDELWGRAWRLLLSLKAEAQLYPSTEPPIRVGTPLATWEADDQTMLRGEDQW